MQQKSQRITTSHQVARRALVVAEVALALVLLVSAGLLLRSLERLFAIEPGFDTSHLVTMQIRISGHRYEEDTARHRFIAHALAAVRRVPGVVSAGTSSLVPFSGGQYDTFGIEFQDGHSYDVYRYAVSPSYFQTMGIPLRRGRLLNEHDTAGAPQAALISESVAKREFGDGDPIGKRAHIGPRDRPWYVVVGVVNDVKQASLAESRPDAVYITPTQCWFADDSVWMIARVHGKAMGLASAIKSAIWSVDKDEAVMDVATMKDLLAKSAAQRRFAMIVFDAFALAALLLAAIGLYGVLAGSVNERTREIGVRTALGASRGDILGLVVLQGLKLAALGSLIGLAAAAGATQGLASLLFGISRLDPITYCGVVVLIATIATVASWVPAWRAARIEPSVALRAE
jgi:putative ABC transport system permease protein